MLYPSMRAEVLTILAKFADSGSAMSGIAHESDFRDHCHLLAYHSPNEVKPVRSILTVSNRG